MEVSKKQRKTEEEKGDVNGEKHLRGKNSKPVPLILVEMAQI